MTVCTYTEARGSQPHTTVGTVKVLKEVYSPQLDNRRDILVYLPPSYNTGDQRYPVIYMHDGQNLFDHHTSFCGEWRVDETLEQLAHEGIEAIVVGIPNMEQDRLNEYGPWQDPKFGGGRGAAYVDFIAGPLRAIINHAFRTRPERESTGIMGSSMGGLISLYASLRHADVFGMVGAMSPSFWFANGEIFPAVENACLLPTRIYMDVGTEEGGNAAYSSMPGNRLQGGMCDHVRTMCERLCQKGFEHGVNLMYVEEQGGRHEEAAWSRRLPQALRFLLAPR